MPASEPSDANLALMSAVGFAHLYAPKHSMPHRRPITVPKRRRQESHSHRHSSEAPKHHPKSSSLRTATSALDRIGRTIYSTGQAVLPASAGRNPAHHNRRSLRLPTQPRVRRAAPKEHSCASARSLLVEEGKVYLAEMHADVVTVSIWPPTKSFANQVLEILPLCGRPPMQGLPRSVPYKSSPPSLPSPAPSPPELIAPDAGYSDEMERAFDMYINADCLACENE